MICDGRGCSVIAHLNCYFSAGSQDANDAITDIEHWHCKNCGGLPRHVHPRPKAAKRARVSFGPDLGVATETLITQRGSMTGLQSGGWGGHWPTRTEMPQLTTGKGKEAMEPPITKSKRPLEAPSTSFTVEEIQLPDPKRHARARHAGSSHQTPGGGSDAAGTAATRDRPLLRHATDYMDYDRGVLAAHPSSQSYNSVAVTNTVCHFCGRTDFWPYLTCGVCQLTTHATCYYRLGSDEATYYETHSSDWRCQDCSGPQRHADCVLPNDEQVIQRHAGPRLSKVAILRQEMVVSLRLCLLVLRPRLLQKNLGETNKIVHPNSTTMTPTTERDIEN